MLSVDNLEVVHSQVQLKTIAMHIHTQSFVELFIFTSLHRFQCCLLEAHFHWLLKCFDLWCILFDVRHCRSCNTCTVGSRLFELWLFECLIIQMLNYPNAWLSKRLDVAIFLAAAGKRSFSHWSFTTCTGESKAAVWTTFPEGYNAVLIQYEI